MRRSSSLLALILAALLVLAACGGDDSGDVDAGTEPTTSGGGGGSQDGGGGDGSGSVSLSGDFSIDAPGGLQELIFESNGPNGEVTGRQLAYANDDFDRVVAFYDAFTAGQTPEWLRTQEGDTVVYSLFGDDDSFSQIVVERNFENGPDGDLITFVLLGASG